MGDRKAPRPVPPDLERPPAPPAPPPITGGQDGRERLERDLGLEINPKTGRAFESQGTFQNLGLGAGGRFYDGRAVPRVARCEACEGMVQEAAWAMGFQNCGALDLGPGGAFFLCQECILKALRLFPRLRALVAAANGGARG